MWSIQTIAASSLQLAHLTGSRSALSVMPKRDGFRRAGPKPAPCTACTQQILSPLAPVFEESLTKPLLEAGVRLLKTVTSSVS